LASDARALGRVVVQHRDVGGLDPHFFSPDLMAVRGAWERNAFPKLGFSLSEPLTVTGCVQFDAAAPKNQRLTRGEFCEKYGLDKANKVAVFLTESPAHHDKEYKKKLKEVFQIVGKNRDFEFVIKPHPKDFAKVKQASMYRDLNTATWEQIVPEATVCEAQDQYDVFRHADVLIARGGTTSLEAGLFRTPFILVDYPEFELDDSHDRNCLKRTFPEPRFDGMKKRKLFPCGMLTARLNEIPDPQVRRCLSHFHERTLRLWGAVPDYIGGECTIEELPAILADRKYEFSDEGEYEEMVRDYCFANDGMAYKRVADLVESVADRPHLAVRIGAAKWRRPGQRLVFHLGWVKKFGLRLMRLVGIRI